MNFNNKVALVTGSSRGIGSSIIKDLAKNGCNVVINYLNSEKEAIKLKEYIKQNYNVEVMAIKCDVSKEDQVISMINTIIERFDKIDILVNNAGIAIDTLFEDKTVANFKKMLDINLIGTFIVSKYVGDIMFKNKYGKIINISSTNGIDTFYPMSIDYDASKAGIISLTHNFAIQYAPYINVNTVAPGWISTDMNKELDDNFIRAEKEKIFLKRFGNPDEIANVVTFLASDNANYINSEVIRVDGGSYHV